ncbi:hypothetical protein GGS21DRAFT_502354 [Xylaria nigripes]|nr:hypothetical protein GGS21DRAFT_502354 [Xylaria nigripes]
MASDPHVLRQRRQQSHACANHQCARRSLCMIQSLCSNRQITQSLGRKYRTRAGKIRSRPPARNAGAPIQNLRMRAETRPRTNSSVNRVFPGENADLEGKKETKMRRGCHETHHQQTQARKHTRWHPRVAFWHNDVMPQVRGDCAVIALWIPDFVVGYMRPKQMKEGTGKGVRQEPELRAKSLQRFLSNVAFPRRLLCVKELVDELAMMRAGKGVLGRCVHIRTFWLQS